jgi:glycosyltransferase involved in cell wall biosynthesis
LKIKNVILISNHSGSHIDRWQKFFEIYVEKFEFINTQYHKLDVIIENINRNHNYSDTVIITGPIGLLGVNFFKSTQRFAHFHLSFGYDLQEPYAPSQKSLDPVLSDFDYTGIIIDSIITKKMLLTYGVEESKIFVLPWGVDKVCLDYDLKLKQKSNRNLVSTRSHHEMFGIDKLIQAFLKYHLHFSDSKLFIFGSGPKTKELVKLVEKLELNDFIYFKGQVEEGTIYEYLKKSTIYLSNSQVDGTSVTLLQAMSYGCVPVCSNVKGNSNLITDEVNGYLFEYNDVESIVDSLFRLENNSYNNKIIEKNKKFVVENANWQENSLVLFKWMENISIFSKTEGN